MADNGARTSTLELVPIHRGGRGGRERTTFDYVIDGRSLAQMLDVTQRDLVGRLDASDRARNRSAVSVLVGEAAADIGHDRIILFECGECGDLGCGALTAALIVRTDTVIWSDLRYENNYDPTMTRRFPSVGQFTFAAKVYRRALEAVGD